MLLDHRPVFLAVTLVYGGQMVRWIKMKLGMEVGLDPGSNTVRWRPSSPSQKRGQQPPNFQPMYCGQTAAWIKMPLGTQVGLGLREVSAYATLC